MATINGTFNSLIAGTLSGTVATPGAQGPAGPTGPTGPAGAPGVGVPAGGLTGQILSKASGTSYDTAWTTLTPGATESWVTTNFLSKAGNLAGLTNLATARDNLQLGTLYTPTFLGLTLQGAGANVANLGATFLTLNHSTYGSFNIDTALGITFPDTTIQTTAFPAGSDMPTGGSTGQSLVKVSNSNYDADWATIAGLPASGTVGQVLTKNSGTSYDASWATLIPGDRYLTTSTTSNTIGNGTKTFTVGTGLSYTPTQSITVAHDANNHMHGEVLTYNSGTGALSVDINHHTGSGTYTAWTVNVAGVVQQASVAWGSITGTLGNQTDLATALNAKLEITDAASTYLPLAGGALNANASVTASDTSTETDSELAGWGLGVQLSADHTKGTTVEFNGLDTYEGELHMQVTPTGLTFPDTSVQITAGIPDAPSDGYTYGRVNGEWGLATPVTNNSQLATTVTTDASPVIYVGGSAFPRNSIIRMTYGADVTVYLENPGVFVAGDQVLIVNQTSGYITFLDDGSCTVLSPAGPYCVTTNGVVAAVYLGDQVWVLSGNLQASV